MNRRYVYCGHGRQRNRRFRFRATARRRCKPLGEPVDFDVRGLGRQLPRTEAPEGWIKKIERRREGKVWVGFFHLWTTDANGRRVRQKKEKTLGPASMPKHEAQSKLAEYIEEYTLCLSQILSAAGTLTCKPDVRSRYSPEANGQAPEIHRGIGNQEQVLPVPGNQNRHRSSIGIVARTVTFRRRAARSGGEARQLAVSQRRRRVLASAQAEVPARPWPARGASWIRDNTPGMISRAGTAKPR